MSETIAAVKDSTILTEPPPAAPKTTEEVLYPKSATEPDPKAVPVEPEAPKPETVTVPAKETPKEPAKTQDTPTDPKPPTDPKTPEVPATTVPVPTDYDLKLPEGSLLSAEELASDQKKWKEAGIPKDQAEALLNTKSEAVKNFNDRQQKALETAKVTWREQCKNDPQIGGENFAKTVELAKRGLDGIADQELKNLVDQTGFGNHPAVVRAFAKLGQMFSEDKSIRGTVGGVTGKRSPEEILYANTKAAGEGPIN